MTRWILSGLLVAGLATACAYTHLESDPLPAGLRDANKLYFVENHGADRRRIDQVIARTLRTRGFDARSGYSADRPERVDVLVTYEDRWQWDMANYLIFLRIDLRDPRTNVLLATGSSYQTSLARKATGGVVAQVIATMLGEVLPEKKPRKRRR